MITLKSRKKFGLSPGSLVYVGDKKDELINMSVIDYNSDRIDIIENATIEQIRQCNNSDTVSWLNISGIHDTENINNIGKIFNIHPLVLEDVLNTQHRAKIDDYDDYLFVVLKMVYNDPEENDLAFEHVCMVIGKRFLISFQERQKDVFNSVRERLKKTKGHIRQSGTDYLAYALMDMVVDHYFVVLEQMGEDIELLQEEALENPTPDTLNDIQEFKHQIILLRKSVWPLREMIGNLQRGESSLIDKSVMIYLKDVYDHVIHVVETIEMNRDILSGITDIYMSSVSNKMNEVMKVLTVIATMFIPLTFLAGVYGMNFKYMPELQWQYAYPVFWALIILILFVMVMWFKNKKWL
jgi:magnesium transporter